MKARPAGSMLTIDDAMCSVREFTTRAELMRYLRAQFDYLNPTEENVTLTHHGYDARIGWDTYRLCIDGQAVLFTDGPLPLLKET